MFARQVECGDLEPHLKGGNRTPEAAPSFCHTLPVLPTWELSKTCGGQRGVSKPCYGVPSLLNLPNTNLLASDPLIGGAPSSLRPKPTLSVMGSDQVHHSLSLRPSGSYFLDWLLPAPHTTPTAASKEVGSSSNRSLSRKAFLWGARFGVE